MTFKVAQQRIQMFALILSIFAITCSMSSAFAQTVVPTQFASSATSVAAPDNLTKNQVDALVARLSDEEVRTLLIRQLDKAAVADQQSETRKTAMDRFVAGLNRAEVSISQAAAAMGQVPQVPGIVWRGITEGTDASTWGVILTLLLFFAIGVGAEWLFRRSMINVVKQAAPDEPLPFGSKFKVGLLRAAIDAIAVIVFVFGAVIAWLASGLPTDNANHLFITLLSGVLVWRFVAVASRLVLAPRIPWLRLPHLSDSEARSAHLKLMLLAGLVVFVLWWSKQLMLGFRIDQAVVAAFGLVDGTIFIVTVIVMIWQLKPRAVETADADWAQDYVSRNWHILATIGVLFIYALALGVNFATGASVLNQAIASLIFLGFIPIIDKSLRNWVYGFLNEAEGEIPAELPPAQLTDSFQTDVTPLHSVEDASQKSAGKVKSYDSVIVGNLRILLFVFAVFVVAEIWDLKLFGLLRSLVGERTASILINISITSLVAYALWGIISTAVARVAGPEPEPGAHAGDGGGVGGTRLGTVLPLFKKFLFVTIIVMLVMIALSSLGVNIGPLIAGAGILGIAIGFGAQTLVKDIVSGLFFLLDDAFRVGEYVNIGDTKGTVEKISVRSLRLRHHNGPLHTVPFGEIQTLTNWSRDWAIMKFEIRVPFETDVDMVRRIIKKVGLQMMEDEELAPFFLQPLKSQGVNRMDDSSFIIRCKFTAIPGNQFVLRREAFMRIQRAFEEKGIKFAPRRVIVETTSAAGADSQAAAGALGAPEAQLNQGKDEPG